MSEKEIVLDGTLTQGPAPLGFSGSLEARGHFLCCEPDGTQTGDIIEFNEPRWVIKTAETNVFCFVVSGRDEEDQEILWPEFFYFDERDVKNA